MTAVSIAGDLPGEIPRSRKSESEKQGDELAKMASSNTSLLVCRICGKKGDHWTTKCPYKDLASMNTLGGGATEAPTTTTTTAASAPLVIRFARADVPPSMRAGASSGPRPWENP